ncbi:MAG: hypothetical protein ACWGQW_06235 [bacterium]
MATMTMGPGGNGLTGDNFRFRFDDGSEVQESSGGATGMAAVNTNISLPQNYPYTFRLRFAVNYEADAAALRQLDFGESLNSAVYRKIYQDGDASEAHISCPTSAWLSWHDDTTAHTGAEQLYTGTWANTTNGYVITGSSSFIRTANTNFPGGAIYGLSAEISLKLIPADLASGDTIDIRPFFYTMTPLSGGYNQTARITITDAVGKFPDNFIYRNSARIWAR